MNAGDLGDVAVVGRIGKRARAAALQERMLRFAGVYNAACLLRHAWHGREARRQECAEALCREFLKAIAQTEDSEAAVYALADSLYASPLGVPWEV
jgi:hypothetical protein